MRASMDPAALRRLGPHLEALGAQADATVQLNRDPLHFARRYPSAADTELAALFASALAFGRVSLFWPVLERLFAIADAAGGPAAFVLDFGPAEANALAPLVYRWNRGPDLALLARAARATLRDHCRLGAVFEAHFRPEHPHVGPALDAGLAELRRHAINEAHHLGLRATSWDDLPRAFRTLLPTPAEGSACKRWNMLLRWMVRPPGPTDAAGRPTRTDGADLGLWRLPPSHLVIPLDVHVARISRLLGLTTRKDDGWRTALDITANLARLDPADPVKYDFALAHLGISGRCQGTWVPDICCPCTLRPVCRAASRD